MHYLRKARLLKIILPLLLTYAFVEVAWGIVYPVYAIYVKNIGGSIEHAGFANALYCLSAGITSIIAGKIENSYKRFSKYFLVLSSVVMSILFTLYPFLKNIYQFFVIQALQGVCSGFFWPMFDSVYSSVLPKNKQVEGWGVLDSTFYFAYMSGSALSGIVASIFGVSSVFFIVGVCFALTSFIFLFLSN